MPARPNSIWHWRIGIGGVGSVGSAVRQQTETDGEAKKKGRFLLRASGGLLVSTGWRIALSSPL